MSLIALGDIHGRDIWKEIVKKESGAEKIVFIGDYFDSHERITTEKQIVNFQEIVDFAKENKDRVVLIIGNHDFHYLDACRMPYSGYQGTYDKEIGELLKNAIADELMQMCFVKDDVCFTHAGVTQSWCKANEIDQGNLEVSINKLFEERPEAFDFTPGARREPTGDEITQTPIWVRPRSLRKDRIENYRQVVGHTIQPQLTADQEIALIDTLGTSGEYLEVREGEFGTKALK